MMNASAAAGTARQKRALKTEELKGTTTKSTPVPPPPPPPGGTRPPTPPPPSSGGGAGSGGSGSVPALLMGSVLVTGVGAYAYYNNMIPGFSPTAEEKKEKVAVADEAGDEAEGETAPASADEPKEEVEEASAGTGGNRVSQIDMPPHMMNKPTSISTSIPEPLPHPANGNRVLMDVGSSTMTDESSSSKKRRKKKKKKEDEADTSSTLSALEQLQTSALSEATQTLVQSNHALWASLDAAFFADMDELSSSQLKARIVQLATEMKDRTQWEAVRLKEFLALKEKEVAQQYMELLQKQRLEFEDLLATRLREQETALHKQFKDALEQKEAGIQSVVNAALAAQQEEHDQDKQAFAAKFQVETEMSLNKKYGEQMESYKKAVEKDLNDKIAALTKLSDMLKKLESALETSQRDQQGSSMAHKLSAAALALSEVLETHSPAAQEVQALQKAAGQDGIIATAVRTLPPTVQTTGVPTLSELQTKFEDNYSTCRQAALVPQGRPGLDGQLAGMVFAALKFPPSPDDPAPEEDRNNPEFVLARARKHVKLGELSAAVDELEKLQGQVAFVIKDWKQAAIDRLAVDKAIKVIKLECALLHENRAK